jgi:hypothetical protein
MPNLRARVWDVHVLFKFMYTVGLSFMVVKHCLLICIKNKNCKFYRCYGNYLYLRLNTKETQEIDK